MYIVISQDLTWQKETIPTNNYICAYYNKYKNTSDTSAFELSELYIGARASVSTLQQQPSSCFYKAYE